ncbi:MAG: hypothetical protein O2843_12085 [Chloroflexi bacterium]|nr:hypothetical protein [Chloroflexota bacterium]
MSRELDSLVGQFFHGGSDGYTPNRAKETVVEVVDPGALLNEFLLELQEGGGDISRWSEEDWRSVLCAKFQVCDDEVSDYLERLASWGVVDNDWYIDEGL